VNDSMAQMIAGRREAQSQLAAFEVISLPR
jgi:hypothetical protein